ncbi:hypothetical protein [Kitasatospora sp. NPDC088134]|uniref:hypothetical protein n=1 Tax=Kitasatospora sp. NPDC088134 TaxID=3364071 RepID=UPI0037F85C8A
MESTEPAEPVRPVEPEGGEPACFLHLACEECGKVREHGRCPHCDAPPPNDRA